MSKRAAVICGIHAVRHILCHKADAVLELWVRRQKKTHTRLAEIVALAEREEISPQPASVETLDKITGQDRHQGVAARCRVATTGGGLRELLQGDSRELLILALDGVQDPHNLGACLRTANAVGVAAVVICKDRAVGRNATVDRIACGAAVYTPVVTVTNLARALGEMRDAGLSILGADGPAQGSLYRENLRLPLALVLGSEQRGLRRIVREQCDRLVHIPMPGMVESLNVSVAAGVCLYEVWRQNQRE